MGEVCSYDFRVKLYSLFFKPQKLKTMDKLTLIKNELIDKLNQDGDRAIRYSDLIAILSNIQANIEKAFEEKDSEISERSEDQQKI